jgi:predicted DNA-binding protein (MmcQ/YjbR family)
MSVTPERVRSLVAELPETQEGAHHGHPDFRVRKKIFATLSETEDRAALQEFSDLLEEAWRLRSG